MWEITPRKTAESTHTVNNNDKAKAKETHRYPWYICSANWCRHLRWCDAFHLNSINSRTFNTTAYTLWNWAEKWPTQPPEEKISIWTEGSKSKRRKIEREWEKISVYSAKICDIIIRLHGMNGIDPKRHINKFVLMSNQITFTII